MSNRYLTDAEKSDELARWRSLAAYPPAHGPGGPDPEMIPWCEQINALDGICTVQSCTGHGPDEHGSCSSGHLWLRLDERKARRLQGNPFKLSQHSGIERVSTIYQPWGQEVVEIHFRGIPDGQLEDSMRTILSYLRSL